MTNNDSRPDSHWDAPPDGLEYHICPECGEPINSIRVPREGLKDCIDHLPIEVLPEVCELAGDERFAEDDKFITVGEYRRCKRALDRAIEAYKLVVEFRGMKK